jgi:hypothetical protein
MIVFESSIEGNVPTTKPLTPILIFSSIISNIFESDSFSFIFLFEFSLFSISFSIIEVDFSIGVAVVVVQ